MADVYGVTPPDVAAEVVNLYPQGFSATTRPSEALVSAWIAEADARAQLALAAVAAGTPSQQDAASPLARAYVVEAVIYRVLRVAYAGKVDPRDLADLMERAGRNASDALKALTALGEAAVGTTVETPPPAVVAGSIPYRDALVTDAMLDGTERRW